VRRYHHAYTAGPGCRPDSGLSMASHVLITGGAGFIGSHTADRLLELGHRVRVLDNLQKPVHLTGKPSYLSPEIEFIQGDVRD
jgi:dTDP-L-rhamnose 4-epimerase